MVKKINLIGVIIGIVIMVCSSFAFSFDVKINNPKLDNNIISSPEREADEYYGGDAYTGMQQAAAQAANNLIPVFEVIKTNNGLIIEAAEAEADNAEAVVTTIKYGVGLILLAIGLTVISKNIVFEISFAKKEEKTQATEVTL